jgi:hypothetical protein
MKTPTEKFFAVSIKHAKHRSVLKGIAFDANITPAYLAGLYDGQAGRCALSGVPMSLERGGDWYGGKNPFVCSMDRIDNSMGYTIGNIHLATARANNLRGDTPVAEFVKFCKLVANNKPHCADTDIVGDFLAIKPLLSALSIR